MGGELGPGASLYVCPRLLAQESGCTLSICLIDTRIAPASVPFDIVTMTRCVPSRRGNCLFGCA
eukprot:5979220-Amphidinium_carterae.1